MAKQRVVVSPMVLLSAVDHYKRMSCPRVVGVLLGTKTDKLIDVTNSFAVPFEEYDDGFFIDTSYLLKMHELYHKVNSKEEILGWYHSGPKLHRSDSEISRAFLKYCAQPVLAVIDVSVETNDIPCQAFQLIRGRELVHVNVQIGADETEEVGVEHLLRDIKEGTGCSIKDRISVIHSSLEAYRDALGEIVSYLESVEAGAKPNVQVMEMLQDILNDVPHISQKADLSPLYVAELSNTLIAMNDLEENSVKNK